MDQQTTGAPGTPDIQRFEAPIHESAERYGLTTDAAGNATAGGLAPEEASAVYFGNWMRGMNQAFVPIARDIVGNDVLFALVSYLAAINFGREMTSEQFGYYIPAEGPARAGPAAAPHPGPQPRHAPGEAHPLRDSARRPPLLRRSGRGDGLHPPDEPAY